MRKLSKLEEGLLRVGNDIQALSRFIGAQGLAFQKLTKKYQKWTGSSKLSAQFQKSVLDHSAWVGSNHKPLAPLLSQYSNLLEVVRAPFDSGSSEINITPHPPEPNHQESIASPAAKELYEIYETGSDVDVDAAFFATPQGHQGGRIVYWVHSDNVIQAHVLLQAFARVRGSSRKGSMTSSAQRSPRDSITELRPTNSGTTEESSAGFAIFDNVENFARRRLKQPDDDTGKIPEHGPRATASLHHGQAEKTYVMALSLPTQRIKLKRKDLRRIFHGEEPSPVTPDSDVFATPSMSADRDENVQLLRRWFDQRPNVRSLVQVNYRRTRFVGLSNTRAKGLWANFDIKVRWGVLSTDNAGSLGLDEPLQHSFPHAILELRWEGQPIPQLVQALDRSHVAERIPGFSIEAHAVAHSIQNIPEPSWQSTVDKDIRTVPSAMQADLKGKQSSILEDREGLGSSSGTQSTGRPSSALFTGPDQSSFTSETDHPQVPDNKRLKGKRRERARRKISRYASQTESIPQRDTRYWNEFDNNEEEATNQPYTILINPDEKDVLGNMWLSLSSKMSKTFRWLPFRSKKREKSGEQRHLLDPEAYTVDSDEDSDSPLPIPRKLSQRTSTRQYSTISNSRQFPAKIRNDAATYRNRLLFRLTLAIFPISMLFFVMSAVLEGTGRRRYTAQDNAIAVVGVVMSVALAILGLFFTFARGNKADLTSRALAVLAMTIVCTSNGILILAMVRGL